MCGIAGYIGRAKVGSERVSDTLQWMKNRGPDAQRSWEFSDGSLNVQLLHSRLAIIDLDERSHQPFSIGPVHLTFNGEIYNYQEIRERLVLEGESFTTLSDTEVLLRAYLRYGESCVDHFEGMWSFAIYDEQKGELFLSRDRFSEKPLYYFSDENGFYFGSEIKFLKALSGKCFEVNSSHLLRYLIQGYRTLYKNESTFYEGIYALAYATNLKVNRELRQQRYRYWKPQVQREPMTFQEAVEGTKFHLLRSMRLRLRGDVPMAFCLSGGVDSASLASIAAKEFNYDVTAFSVIDQDPRYNELENITATVQDIGCKHHLIHLEQKGSLSRLQELVDYHDGPLATISYFVHSYLSEAISKGGFKVAFSGTSADELFTGYYDHYLMHLYEVRNGPFYADALADWNAHVRGNIRNADLANPHLFFKEPRSREYLLADGREFRKWLKPQFQCEFLDAFEEESFTDSLLRNRMLNELFHEVTPVILHEDDLNSMLFSVENRSPFLDTALFNFANSIPVQHLIQDGYSKVVLREAVKGILNEKVRLDRKKKGFNASINSVINFDDASTREYLLSDSPIYEYFEKEKIVRLFNSETAPNSMSKFLFGFINAKIFLESNSARG